MHLDDDPDLEAIDALSDTLGAARLALETMAASALDFSAQARIHRESTRLAREWVREHIDLSPLPAVPELRDEETDEILRQTVEPDVESSAPSLDAAPLDTGPEGAADDPPPLTEETSEAPMVFVEDEDAVDLDLGSDLPLVAFEEDDLLDDDVDVDSLVQGLEDIAPEAVDDEEEMSSDAGLIEVSDDVTAEIDRLVSFDDSDMDSLVSFSDESDGDSLVSFSDDSDLGEDSVGGLVADESPAVSELEDLEGELVTYDDEAIEELGLVTLDGEDAVEFVDDESYEDADDVHTPGADEGGIPEGTLVADLASLVQLKDLLEDDGSGVLAQGERPATPRGADPRLAEGSSLRVTTTLTDEDLGKLGFSSRDDLVSPEGSDADPNSETGSAHVRLDSESPRTAPRRGGDAYGTPSGASVSIPTIRDSGSSATRPSAAAVRINPEGGGGAVIEEQEILALGEADEGSDDGGRGLSLDVEEYEFEDEEVDELDEVMPDFEPEPEPMPMPELSAAKEQDLLQKAHLAYQDGKLQEAAELYSDVLDFDPDNADAALGRGRAYLDLADYARAMSDFTVAEDLRPEDPDTNAAIGELYYARKDYGRAIEYFDRALDQDPKHAMAWCRRGIAHYYRKDYDQAYDDLVRAQKLDDSIPNIRTYIGMVKKKRR